MTVSTATFAFLKDLEKNNDRAWFEENKARYQAALGEMKAFTTFVETGLNMTDVLEKARLLRIYRDVRFSKDDSPFKNYFGAGFSRASAQRRGGYYLHIEPGNAFAGGGFWAPEPHDLKRIRDEFAMDAGPIRKIMADKTFKKYFGDLAGEEVKTAPKGYRKDDPNIGLIRRKQFIVTRQFSDEEVLHKNFGKEVVKTFEAMRPYFDYMSIVLTTDLNGVSLLDG